MAALTQRSVLLNVIIMVDAAMISWYQWLSLKVRLLKNATASGDADIRKARGYFDKQRRQREAYLQPKRSLSTFVSLQLR